MTKHFCEISEKEIKDGESNFGRSPLVVPVSSELSMHILFVQQDGRCNVADVSKTGVLQALDLAKTHVKGPVAEPAAELPAKTTKGAK